MELLPNYTLKRRIFTDNGGVFQCPDLLTLLLGLPLARKGRAANQQAPRMSLILLLILALGKPFYARHLSNQAMSYTERLIFEDLL